VNLHNSVAGKIWRAVSTHGLRAGLQALATRWFVGRMNNLVNVSKEYEWILNQDRPAELDPPLGGPLRINWLIPGFGPGGGGLFHIFRVTQHLERWGHRQRVYVVCGAEATPGQLNELARRSYPPIKTELEVFRGEVVDSDALVATSWPTAYSVRGLGNTARKFYFVQDLEHLFYAAGSRHEFARRTYEWGFYGICSGRWLAETLSSEFGMECSAIGFSYDRDTYSPNGDRVFSDGKKRVLFYARPATERRGYELGVLALQLVARRAPNVEFVLVGFPAQGVQVSFPAVLPGILPASELPLWYRSCSVALVLSHTNLSYAPLELMACGCAVVSNSGKNVEWLLNDEIAKLASPTPEALASAIVELLEDEELCAKKAAAGRAFAGRTNSLTEIKNIEQAFYQGLGIPLSAGKHA